MSSRLSEAAAPLPALPFSAAAPTHSQTVALVVYFDFVRRAMEVCLRNPQLGIGDLRREIGAEITNLLVRELMTVAQADMQFGKVPARPADQKNYVETIFRHSIAASERALDDHRTACVRFGVPARGYFDKLADTNLLAHYLGIGGMH